MKRARQRRIIKPRNPVAVAPLLGKGGVHQRRDKRAARALQTARLRRLLEDER
jgi:hypothetical protein